MKLLHECYKFNLRPWERCAMVWCDMLVWYGMVYSNPRKGENTIICQNVKGRHAQTQACGSFRKRNEGVVLQLVMPETLQRA